MKDVSILLVTFVELKLNFWIKNLCTLYAVGLQAGFLSEKEMHLRRKILPYYPLQQKEKWEVETSGNQPCINLSVSAKSM